MVIILWTIAMLSVYAQSAPMAPANNSIPPLDLQKWQSLLIGDQPSRKVNTCFVMPRSVSIETIRAQATIACKLGDSTNSQNIELIDNPKEAQNIIIIGTPQESSAITKLLPQLPFRLSDAPSGGALFCDAAGKAIASDSGIVALVRDPEHPNAITLVVTGASPTSVLKAAVALTNQNLNPVVTGSFAIINEPIVAAVGKNSSTNRLHYMPATKSFTLKDLGYKTMSAHGVYPETFSVEFNTAPGIAFLGPAPRLYVVYGYSSQLNPEQSSLDVRLNDVPIGSFPLAEEGGDVRSDIDCTMPVKLIGPRNKLDFVFNLVPEDTSSGTQLTYGQLHGTLFEDTWLEIDRENLARLPDLSLFKYGGFPLVKDGSLKDLAIVLPSKTPISFLDGLTKFSLLLGQWAASSSEQVQVFYDDNLPKDIRNSHNLVVFSQGKDSNAIETELSLNANYGQDDRGLVQEILSPWAANKVIMVVSAPTFQSFQYALAGLVSTNVRDKLMGSVCTISPQLVVQGTISGEQRLINTIAPWRYAGLVLSTHVWLAPLLVILFVIIAAFSLKSLLDRKRVNQHENTF
jgi:hypothetical protein